MYQALYRKYRPNDFNEVVGQKILVETLKNAIINNKISHAYLFAGPRGTGKTSIAKIFAKTVNCQNSKNALPCCKCVSCTQIQNKQSTDIIEIDAASNNGVDEIREIRNKVNLVPSVSKYKIYIIDEVHMLTTGAFNALLKTLEEPPSHIIFILATTEPHKIPSTILSRCQRFDFKRINDNDIIDRLSKIAYLEKISISDEAIKEIALISDGGLRDAINLLDQLNSFEENNITIDDVHKVNGSLSNDDKLYFINALINKKLINILKMTDRINDEGKNIIKVMEDITITLKDILMKKVLSNNEKDNIYNDVGIDVIINLIEIVNNNLNSIKQANDPKLAIELLMIKLCNNAKKTENINIIKSNQELENLKNEDYSSMNAEKDTKKICQIEIENSKKLIDVKPEKPENNFNNIKNLEQILSEIKERRIDNTLARFDKTKLKLMKEKLKKLDEYLLDNEYIKSISLIKDGELKAASDEYLIFIYSAEGSSYQFNLNIEEIEKTIKDILNENYKVISTDTISWEIIKNEFNSKQKKYIYIPEKSIDLKKYKEKNNYNSDDNELKQIFQNIIEYE